MVLAVPDETALRVLAERLTTSRIQFVRVEEPDASYFGSLMAIGVRPGAKGGLSRHFASLPLLR